MAHDHTPPMEQSIDAWHTHGGDEPMPQQEHAAHVNIGALLIVFVAMVAAILIMVIGLTLFYNHSAAQLRAEKMENVVEYRRQYEPYHETAVANISTYRRLDETQRTVQIPVDRAAELVAERYNGSGE
ncbi:MAG: hypothetical protein ACTS22_03365 [Phycisphaerales bacterium]